MTEDVLIEEEELKDIKRLVIDLPFNQHKRIKERALIRNISIKKWVLRAIRKAEIEEDSRL